MLVKDQKLYYSAGELAGLFGIPKQTMFYYVKMGLLVPDYIAENGYRYFGDSQYLNMEIIYFLRKLDIPVPDIKAYLRSNDIDKLIKLLASKRQYCINVIRHQQGLLKALEACEERLISSRHLVLDRVLLKDCPEKYYIVSTYASARAPHCGDSRALKLLPGIGPITVRAAHVSQLFANMDFKDCATGWIVLQDTFFGGNPAQSFAVMTEIFARDGLQKANFIAPAGLYMVLHLKGDFFRKAGRASRMMSQFLIRNHLRAVGDIFVKPRIDYWSTSDPTQYVNTLLLQVAPLDPSRH